MMAFLTRVDSKFVWILFAIALAIRLTNIDALAPLVDETGHLWESVNYSMYAPLDRLLGGKYLGYLFYKPIFLAAWDPLYVARAFTAIMSIISAYFIYKIGSFLGTNLTGTVSAVVYLLSPFNFFFDRQALFDPLVVTLYAASLYFFLFGIRNRAYLVLSGGIFFIACCLKVYVVSGMLLFFVFFYAIKLKSIKTIKPLDRLRFRVVAQPFVAGFVLCFLLVLVLSPVPESQWVNIGKLQAWHSDFLLQKPGENRSFFAVFSAPYKLVVDYYEYVGVGFFLFLIASFLFCIHSRRYFYLCVAISAFAIIMPYGILTTSFSRYVLYIQVPLSLFSGLVIVDVIKYLRIWNSVRVGVGGKLYKFLYEPSAWVLILFSAALLQHAYTEIRMAANPYYRIAQRDRIDYQTGWGNAIGLNEVVSELKNVALLSDKKIHVVTIGWGMHGSWTLPLKLRGSGYPITFYHSWIYSQAQRDKLKEVMKTNRLIFFIEHPVDFVERDDLLKIGSGVKTIFTYQKADPNSSYELLEVLP